MPPKKITEGVDLKFSITVPTVNPGVKKVIYNDPATIVIWDDGSKTVVKCQEGDTFDERIGLAMAICKKFFGGRSHYNEIFEKWVPEKKTVIKVKQRPGYTLCSETDEKPSDHMGGVKPKQIATRRGIDHGKIVACYTANPPRSVTWIADECGCSAQTVINHLKAEGIYRGRK